VVLLILCLALVFVKGDPLASKRAQKLHMLAAAGTASILVHDLWDFSLASGAVGMAFGLLLGMIAPASWLVAKGLKWRVVCALLVLAGFAGAVRYDPYQMELAGQLDRLPERLGQRPYRYWLNQGQQAATAQARVAAYARAVSMAPGDRRAWFRLGDGLWESGLTDQALLAYRRGLEATRTVWCGLATQRIAALPLSMIERAVGDHRCAAKSVAQTRWREGPEALAVLRRLDQKHQDPELRKNYMKALTQAGHRKSLVVPELWRLAQGPPTYEEEGVELVQAIERMQPEVSAAQLYARLVAHNSKHCLGLMAWKGGRITALVPYADQLDAHCRSALVGRGLARQALADVRAAAAP
jgi:hypothetical protein